MVGAFRAIIPVVVAISTIFMVAPPTHATSNDLLIHNFDRISPLHEDSRSIKDVSTLEVNTGTTYRLVAANKCEATGEADLRRLSETALVEEAYVFVPALCLWIEVGYDESSKSVRLDMTFVTRMLKYFDSLVVYHTHLGSPRTVTGYFPAYTDLLGLVLLNARHLRDTHINIRHRAITSRGTIEYGLSISQAMNQLLDKIYQTGLGNFAAQNLAYEMHRSRYKKDYYDAVGNCVTITQDQPDNLANCFPMRTSAFILKFRALDEYAVTFVEE